jgi:hypothetical protein
MAQVPTIGTAPWGRRPTQEFVSERRSGRAAGADEVPHDLGEFRGGRSNKQVAPTLEPVELGAGDVLGHVASGLHWKEPVFLSVQYERRDPEVREQVAYLLLRFRIELVVEHFARSCSAEPETDLDEVPTSRFREDSGVVQLNNF